MKHIRYQFLALLSVSALTFISCDLIGSIDDMEPDHVVTDLNYITDAASAQTALNGVYASWRSTGVSYLRYGIASMAHTQAQAMVMGADEFAAENKKDIFPIIESDDYFKEGIINGPEDWQLEREG